MLQISYLLKVSCFGDFGMGQHVMMQSSDTLSVILKSCLHEPYRLFVRAGKIPIAQDSFLLVPCISAVNEMGVVHP